jgi:putative ABC transport system permease protein
MLKNYFKTAWRSLLKTKAISSLNIAGLSIGMAAAVMIFLWVQNEMSFDGYHKDAYRIYRLTTRLTDKSWTWEGSPGLLAEAAKKEIPQIEKISRLYVDNWPVFNIKGRLDYEKTCAYVDDDWFKIFQYHFTQGDASAFAESPYSIILTATAAKKYFGNDEAVGQRLLIDSLNYEVKGVVSDAPSNSSFQYSAFMPMAVLMSNKQQRENIENWDQTDYLTFIKLAADFPSAEAAKRLTEVHRKYTHDDSHVIATSLEPLKDMHFENGLQGSEFGHGNIHAVYIFSVLGFLLLLVACINYVNLTTAKASLRSKEVSIRKIVGAQRRQLFYQFFVESLLASLLSLFVTLLIIRLCLPAFNAMTGKEFMFSLVSFNIWKVLGSTLLAAFLLNGIYPALLLSSFKPLNIFRGVTVLKVKDVYFRKGLVILQFSISILLMTSTIVIYRQMHFIQKSNPGYDRSQVLSIALPFAIHLDNKEQLMQTIKQELLNHTSIENIALVNQPMVQIGSATTSADWDGRDTSFRPKVSQLSADAGLQKTMRLKMAEGRWFELSSEMDTHNFILNEAAVREFNIRTPVIGQRFSLHGETGRIIGVVRDFNFRSMHEKTGPLVIFNNAGWWNYFLIRTTPQNAAGAVEAVENTWKQMMPGIPFEYSFLDEKFDDLYKQDQQASLLIFIFAVIAVFISALGLFGLASFAAEQRTKEIGIRKILGATFASIGALLSRDFIKLVGIAVIIASPLAWWAMSSWLQNFAYRITMSWWMIGLAGIMAFGIALVITCFHAVKANRRNPVSSLRSE